PVYLFCQQLCMLWIGPAISAYINIPPPFNGYKAKILVSGLRTFPDTSGNPALYFMWRSYPFITVLYIDGKSDTFIHSIPAPCRTYTTFDGSERFTVGLPRFKALCYQFLPYKR